MGLIVAVVALAAAVGLALGVSAFTSPGTKSSGRPAAAATAAGASAQPSAAATTPSIPKVKVTAVGLVKGLQPWAKPLTLHVRNGSLLSVSAVDDTGVALTGTPTATSWVSTAQVIPNRTYQLQAKVRGVDGVTAYHTLSIRSTPPDATIGTSVILQQGKTVGVAYPIVVYFTKPVAQASRATVEQALTVTMSDPVTAGWHWFSSTEVHFRGQSYWPAGEQLTLHDHLTDVQLAPGVWGDSDRDLSWSIGDAHISTVDVSTQHMTVKDNGKVIHVYKVSTGKPDFPTKGGVHIVLNKTPSTVMDSTKLGFPQMIPGPDGKLVKDPNWYHETVLWDVRISDGGAFVHYAPWSVAHQGIEGVSHGCVNVDKAPAIAFYDFSVPGDVVDIIHPLAPPKLDDPGMMDWNLTWAQWTAGSALVS